MSLASIVKRYNNDKLSTLDHPLGPTTQLMIDPCLMVCHYPSQSVDPHPYPTKLRLLPPNFTVPDFISSLQKKRESQQSKENAAEPLEPADILHNTFDSPTDSPISKSTCSSSHCSSSHHSSSHHSLSSFTSPLPPHTPCNLRK
jgi:hypothetical protein